MDRDFGQLIFSRRMPAVGVVLFRDTYDHAEQAAQLLEQCLQQPNIRLLGMFTVLAPTMCGSATWTERARRAKFATLNALALIANSLFFSTIG